MAVSKSQKAAEKPNATAFAQILDDGLAEAAVVSQAFQAALGEWKRQGGRTDDREVVGDVRPHPDPTTPEARLTSLWREGLFVDEEPHVKRHIQKEES